MMQGAEAFMENKARVMIVDDDALMLEAMASSLDMMGYECIPVNDSREAMKEATLHDPDLFLLDMNMPDVTGLEVLKQLKSDVAHADKPAIFITAVDDREAMAEAFSAGAVDYIMKPAHPREVELRIRTHLHLATSRHDLKTYAKSLEELADERARQLVHADRLATLGTLSAGVAHEINNPLTFISGNVQMLDRFWEILRGTIQPDTPEETRQQYLQMLEVMPRMITGMKEGISRIHRIVSSLKTYARREGDGRQPFPLHEPVEGALELCNKTLSDHHVQVAMAIHHRDLVVLGDSQQIEQVLVNLIVNAVDAADAGDVIRDLKLDVELTRFGSHALISVGDNGPGIDPEVLTRIWEPFFTTKVAGKGTGLGLSIARSIVEGHQGQILAANREQGGMQFDVLLPLYGEYRPRKQ